MGALVSCCCWLGLLVSSQRWCSSCCCTLRRLRQGEQHPRLLPLLLVLVCQLNNGGRQGRDGGTGLRGRAGSGCWPQQGAGGWQTAANAEALCVCGWSGSLAAAGLAGGEN